MNKEEVKFDHFKDIEELIKHLEMWYAEDDYFAYERYFHLRDARIMGMFIYELQQENKQLKDNWNKLKEWASNFYNSEEVGWAGCGMRYTLEKIQELEQGSDNNE